MLKKIVCLLSVFVIIVGMKAYSQNQSNSKNVMIYNINNKEFNVVVMKNGMKKSEVKTMGLQHAAKIAVSRGYKYFEVSEESDVSIVRGKKNWPSAYDFPQNLYQEEVVERGYNRERFYHKQNPDTEPKKALKLKVKCVETKTRSAYEACKYTKC